MREINEWFQLDRQERHFIRVIRQYHRGLSDFVVLYLFKEGESFRQIVRFDCAHGFAHRDLPFLPISDKRRKTLVPGLSLPEQLNYAINDIRLNWPKYFLESRGK